MPCRCDYMEPTQREAETQLVCQLLVYVKSTGIFKWDLSKNIAKGAKHIYGRSDVNDVDELTRQLCEFCQIMEETGLGRKALYDGKNPDARRLADWWKKHQEMDKKREKEESEKVRLRNVRKNALAKLTDEERRVLGI